MTCASAAVTLHYGSGSHVYVRVLQLHRQKLGCLGHSALPHAHVPTKSGCAVSSCQQWITAVCLWTPPPALRRCHLPPALPIAPHMRPRGRRLCLGGRVYSSSAGRRTQLITRACAAMYWRRAATQLPVALASTGLRRTTTRAATTLRGCKRTLCCRLLLASAPPPQAQFCGDISPAWQRLCRMRVH